MPSTTNQTGPRYLDPLGKLCYEGQQVATYLFQVPDDESQLQRLREIVKGILQETATVDRRELPRIAQEMWQALAQPPSVVSAEQFLTGFDRMIALWKAARSGIF